MHLTFLGHRWKFRFVPNLGPARGYCDHPSTPGKEIKIQAGLPPEEQVEVLTHEFLHACDWRLDEEFVAKMGRDISHALWRLGYRKVVEDTK